MVIITKVFVAVFIFFILQAQSPEFYVSNTGRDNRICGSNTPCQSVEKAIDNYKNFYSDQKEIGIIIDEGSFAVSPIIFPSSIDVFFEGEGSTEETLFNAELISGSFFSCAEQLGLVFYSLTINATGSGDNFIVLEQNSILQLEAVTLIYACEIFQGGFIQVSGGIVDLEYFSMTDNDGINSFLIKCSEGKKSAQGGVVIETSTFFNITFGKNGGLLSAESDEFDAVVILDGNVFENIKAEYAFISFLGKNVFQSLEIINNDFGPIQSYLPCVYIESQIDCYLSISNSTFSEASSEYFSGALGINAQGGEELEHVSLHDLTFSGCSGPLSGAFLVAYNTLNISNSFFSGNSGKYANDIVQLLDNENDNDGGGAKGYKIYITGCFSSSGKDKPRVVVYYQATNKVDDKSSLLPDL